MTSKEIGLHSRWTRFACSTVCGVTVLSSSPAVGQSTFSVDQLSVDNGLSQNTVYSVFQDRTGFMWFGTMNGIDRYDGYSVRNYHEPIMPAGTPSAGSVCAIAEWKGRLWVGWESGRLTSFDPAQDGFRSVENASHLPSITALCVDERDDLWIGTGAGLYILRKRDGQFVLSRAPGVSGRYLESEFISVLCRDSAGHLLAGTYQGLYRWGSGASDVQWFGRGGQPGRRLSCDTVEAIFCDGAGAIWIGTSNSLDMLSGAGGTTHPGLMTGGEITALCEDAQRILWVGTREEGIFLFDRSRASVVQHLTPSTDRRDCLQCGTILSLLRDHAGIVWLGTATAGAAKVVPDLIHFSDYRFGSAVHHNETVWSLLQTRSEYPERLLVGTTDGLYEFNGVSGGRKCLWRSTHQVRAFLEDSLGEKGALWVGTLGGGLVKLRPGASKMDLVKTYYTNRREDNESCIYAMIQDKAGTLWIGTNGGGLLSFSELTGTTVRHPMIADADTSTWAISLHQDQSGAIWAGTWKHGLWCLTPGGGRCEKVRGSNPTKSFLYESIYAICGDFRDSSALWLGTSGDGLLRYDKHTGNAVDITELQGLADNTVYGILQDAEGFLWVSTNNGLSRFNPSNGQFMNFSVKEGLGSNEFNLGAQCIGRDGKLYFGGHKGFVGFVPSLGTNPVPPHLVLESVHAFGKSLYGLSAESIPHALEFSHDARFFSFQFAALHYKDPAKNLYSFKIEGLDTAWSQPSTYRMVDYASIPSGIYSLRARSANCDGVWDMDGVVIPIIVRAPYWGTWWFAASTLAFLTFVAGISYRIKFRRDLAEERKAQKGQEVLRKKLAADFHDELGAHAAKIAFSANLLHANTNERFSKQDEHLSQIAWHASLLMKEMREMAWQLDPQKDSLMDLAVHLKDFSEELFESTQIAFRTVGLTASFENLALPMEWRQQLLRIFKEAMTNVIKHATGSRNVSLSFLVVDRSLRMELSDDGNGFSPLAASQGNGLKNMEFRADQIGGVLTITSTKGAGTNVRFEGQLP